jgi:hypothetical protein
MFNVVVPPLLLLPGQRYSSSRAARPGPGPPKTHPLEGMAHVVSSQTAKSAGTHTREATKVSLTFSAYYLPELVSYISSTTSPVLTLFCALVLCSGVSACLRHMDLRDGIIYDPADIIGNVHPCVAGHFFVRTFGIRPARLHNIALNTLCSAFILLL